VCSSDLALGLHGWLAELGSAVQQCICSSADVMASGCSMSHPAGTNGGYSANYLLFGIDPSAAAHISDVQAVRE